MDHHSAFLDTDILEALHYAVRIAVKRAVPSTSVLPNAIEHDDLVQQCWLYLPHYIDVYVPRDTITFISYLAKMLTYELWKYLKRWRGDRSRAGRAKETSMAHTDMIKLADAQPSATEDLPSRLAVLDTLARVQSAARLVLALHGIMNLSFREIAQQLGLSKTAVYDLWNQGKAVFIREWGEAAGSV